MPEPILILLGVLVAGGVVLAPLWRRPPAEATDDARDAAEVRHRVALETLRDVEADRRAGSLDEAAYAEQLAEAEARAAATAAALDTSPEAPAPARLAGRTAAIATAGVLSAALIGGSLLPGGGVANTTVVNEALAAAEAAEAARGERIERLLDDLAEQPEDADTLSALADAYLAGTTRDDLRRAVAALQVLIALEPERADAYERVIGAYLRADDFSNARRALDAYEAVATADPAEVAFYGGFIALRGEDDPEAAAEAFGRFLELAPDDPRAEMVRGLRDEAAGSD
jgi:cytochrome c-type biogenesis protein CcmI